MTGVTIKTYKSDGYNSSEKTDIFQRETIRVNRDTKKPPIGGFSRSISSLIVSIVQLLYACHLQGH